MIDRKVPDPSSTVLSDKYYPDEYTPAGMNSGGGKFQYRGLSGVPVVCCGFELDASAAGVASSVVSAVRAALLLFVVGNEDAAAILAYDQFLALTYVDLTL